MTAILKDLRSLRAAHERGEITPEQFARAEAVLHDLVEDAVVDGTSSPTRPKRPTANAPPPASAAVPRAQSTADLNPAPPRLWETALMVVAALACLTMLAATLIGSLTLALTLLVTTIAAGTVWALKNLDE